LERFQHRGHARYRRAQIGGDQHETGDQQKGMGDMGLF